MNSMSKNYYKDDRDPCKKEHEREQCQTIIKCGSASSTTIPAGTVAGTTFTVGSLTLNTSGLFNPSIKLEYASNLQATAFTGIINFQVFKLCSNQLTSIPIGPTWTFSEVAAVTNASTFSFFIFDCDSCFNECCTYTVIATVTSAVTVGTLSINNATLGAIATNDSTPCC